MSKTSGKYQYVVMQSAAVATGNGKEILPSQMDDGSLSVLTLQIVGITTAVITFEASIDGTNYVAIQARNLNTQIIATTATADGLYRINAVGYSNVRARISAWTSGTIYVYGVCTADGESGIVALVGSSNIVTPIRSATATLSNVASSASSVTILAANTSRLGASVYNDSTALLYVKLGTTASSTSHTVQVTAGAYYEVPFNYTGIITGIWASATGSARVTENT